MSAQNAWRDDLTDLLISDHETAGRPVLPAGSRPRVQTALETILTNESALHGHVRDLQGRLGRQFRHTRALPDEQHQAVLARGLDALDDAALAALALNPVALWVLALAIGEELPAAWLAPLEQGGRALLREHGRCPWPPPAGAPDPAAEEEAGLLVTLSEECAAPPGAAAPAALAHWHFVRRAEECTWHTGTPPAAGTAAVVQATWNAPGYLLVRPAGFLTPGPGARVHVSWCDASGALRAEGEVADRPALVRLESGDRQAPRPGDRLHVRHTRQPKEGPGWEVGLVVQF
jgi:hypothetical protein